MNINSKSVQIINIYTDDKGDVMRYMRKVMYIAMPCLSHLYLTVASIL